MLTVVCISWCEGVALSRESTHAGEYHEKQQLEDNREQVHLSRIANSQLEELQLLPTLTTEVYLNGVRLGEPLFTEEELTLAMTRTTISSWVEGRWRPFHNLDSASQCPSESSAIYKKNMRSAVGRNTIVCLSLLAWALRGLGKISYNGVNGWGVVLRGFTCVCVLYEGDEWKYKI